VRLRAIAGMALATAAGIAAAQPKSDWEKEDEERNWREAEVVLPAYPRAENLLEFFVSSASPFRFYIDRPSLSVGADGVVRYTLVVRSPAGAETVSYEGMRCRTGEVKVFAFGRPDRSWAGHAAPWRRIEMKSVQRWHNALYGEYFCPSGAPILSAADGLDALRAGEHRQLRQHGNLPY